MGLGHAMSPSPNSIPSGSMDHNMIQETSKFGFGYEPLSHSIDELEICKENHYSESMFEQAKKLIFEGREAEADQILKTLLDDGDIRYKHMSAFGSNLLMSTFAPDF